MSAPQPFVLGRPSSVFVDRPCPLCRLTAPILVIDPPVRRAHSCRCGALVGTHGRFVGDRGAHQPMRAVFSPPPPSACATCRRAPQRVLMGDRPGSWCAMCDLVGLPERRAPPKERTSLARP